MRVGFGYDSHRFAANEPFDGDVAQKLGGVPIHGCPKLIGHSDADVLIHAVIDALLGAAALGDIGSPLARSRLCGHVVLGSKGDWRCRV